MTAIADVYQAIFASSDDAQDAELLHAAHPGYMAEIGPS